MMVAVTRPPVDPALTGRLRRAHALVARRQGALQTAKGELLEVVAACSAAGMSLSQIGDVLGVGKTRVQQLVDQARAR